MPDISPTHDAYAQENEPSTTHNVNPLQAGGASPTQIITYFTFPLPAGTFDFAELRLYVPAGSGNESTATFFLDVADAGFDENTLLWTNRPGLTATRLWSGAPFTAADAQYLLPLNAALVSQYAGTNLTVALHSAGVSDICRWNSNGAGTTLTRRPLLTVTERADVVSYTMTITHAANSALVKDRTYKLDFTASNGAVSLVQIAGAAVAPVESPTKVFTFADPGIGGDLEFDAKVGVTTKRLVISRLARPSDLTFYGGSVSSMNNWG